MAFNQMSDDSESQRLWEVYAAYQAQQFLREDDEWHLDVANFFAILERYFFWPRAWGDHGAWMDLHSGTTRDYLATNMGRNCAHF